MPVSAVLFDLDGTLLPMDYDLFIKTYFGLLAGAVAPLGYEPKGLIDAVWKGTASMVKNNGGKTNEEAFWDTFCTIYGEAARAHIPHFDHFYRTDFRKVKDVCGYTPMAAETVQMCRDAGLQVVLATNPIFPLVATESRLGWTGMKPEDFAYVTTYENSRWCKPNPAYYQDICRQIGIPPEECLMVGNDVSDDMPAGSIGMKVFLLTDCLLNPTGEDLSAYPHGDFAALQNFIRTLCI
ncbi:MAG: HAD family hydrolase [Clostridia bacterium]|nr:HAD family hydrolase [Clostridia bacterium]